jgi:dihydrofolate reductase
MVNQKYPITLIAAVAENGIIGNQGKLPWNIPEELQHFKKSTLWKPIIMGRTTMESLGRPLPHRLNVVLSSTLPDGAGVHVARTTDEAMQLAASYLDGFTEDSVDDDYVPEIMVIGGANVYDQFLPLADYLLLTRVKQNPEGDVSFPLYDLTQWELMWSDDKPGYTIERWRRLIGKPESKQHEEVLKGVQDASRRN